MLAVAVSSLAMTSARAQAPPASVCLGDLVASGVERKPGPALTFGINPAGEAGALGPRVEPVPETPERTHVALAQLRAPGTNLVLRLNRFFWSEGEPGVKRFFALAERFTSRLGRGSRGVKRLRHSLTMPSRQNA